MNFSVKKSGIPTVGYPEHYKEKDIAEQIHIFTTVFNISGIELSIPEHLPKKSEGVFVFLHQPSIHEDYQRACHMMLDFLHKQYSGNILSAQSLETIYEHDLLRTERTRSFIEKNIVATKLYAMPAQTGLYYKNKSVAQAKRSFSHNEFGLGIFELLCITLTHPERFTSFFEISAECSGDTLLKNPDLIPTIEYIDGLIIEKSNKTVASEYYGTASGFFMK